MSVPVLLAHGALGGFDELIFLGIAVAFIVMMGIAWVRSRNTEPDFGEESPPNTPTTAQESDSPDHFHLD